MGLMVRPLRLVGLSVLVAFPASAQELLFRGPLRPGMQAFPASATLRVKAGTVLEVEPGSTQIRIQAAKIILEPGVVIRGAGRAGVPGADAAPRTDEWVSSTEYAKQG